MHAHNYKVELGCGTLNLCVTSHATVLEHFGGR